MAIAFIPVRGGSKSIPFKNIKPLNGRPLVYWSLLALEEAKEITSVIVATDSDEIASTVASFGLQKPVIYWRNPKNAADSASTESVMLEYLELADLPSNELFVLAQATSPLTIARNFSEAIKQLESENADSILSCVRTKRFFWNDDGTTLNYNYKQRPRRQDFNGLLMENGAFYINRVGNILRDKNRLSGNIITYEMPEYSAYEIDEPDDWLIIEQLMKHHHSQPSTAKVKQIKLLLTDVDGTLTDAGMYYSEDGNELKKFSTYDGKAFELLRNAGIKTGIITTEETSIVKRRAEKIKADYIYQGVAGITKLDVAKNICEEESITLDNVAYVGDDLNCFELLSKVGLAACPRNAVVEVKNIPGIIQLQKCGGEGAVREFSEIILQAKV